MKIKVMADYECWPLWWDGDGLVDNVAPADLGLSDGLTADLCAWAAAYDATLDRDDPAASRFASSEEERSFHARGERLAARVAEELGPAATVRYRG